VKTGYAFAGWNTAANGSGASYTEGQTFAMGSSNVTLYAQWTALPTYTVTYNGNGNTGGSVPTDSNAYYQGDTVTVLGNTGNLTKTGYTFAGWNTAANGSGTSYAGGATFAMGTVNVTLYAQWAETNLDQSQLETSAYLAYVGTGSNGIAQTFTAGTTGSLNKISFYIAKGGTMWIDRGQRDRYLVPPLCLW